MALRVVQWATGGVGVAAIKGVLEHPDLELVGCWVHSEAKGGKDVGELAGVGPLGVTATNSVDEILALDADAVIYTPLMANPDEMTALLRSGKNVITPTGWFFPSERQSAPFVEAGLEGSATLHGTGIAPGGITDKFLLMVSAMSTAVSMLKMQDGLFMQAVKMCVAKIGFNAEPKIRSSQEVAVATAPIESPLGPIQPGQVAGRKFHWEAFVGDDVVVRVTVNWFMGEENLDPPWTFGSGGQRYEMEVKGNPDFTVSFKGFQSELGEGEDGIENGIVATAAHCVNSVPAVCAAEPGVATYLDLPLISGRAAPHLR